MTKFVNPVPSGRFTDGFSPNRGYVPGLGDLGAHTGRDIAAPAGTPIKAVVTGTVVRKWWDVFASGGAAGGNMVAIRSDDGIYEVRYAHMLHESPLDVGDRVIAGVSDIGKVGSTGAATGDHLHLEVLKHGAYVDPDPYITGGILAAPSPEEDDMTIYLRRNQQGKVYAYNVMTKKHRALTSLEWTVIQRAYKAAGMKVPVTNEGPAALKALIGKEQ